MPNICWTPIQNLIINALTQLEMPLTNKPKILCFVLENNQGAYLVVTNQQLSVRPKYFYVKYHCFFWQFVYHPEGLVLRNVIMFCTQTTRAY